MSSSSASREERRAALLMLQRLLWDAEASLSTGDAGRGRALQRVGKAFELFRNRQESGGEPTRQTPDGEGKRRALLTLARLLAEMDEAVARGDAKSIQAAVEKTREALDIARCLDDSLHSSGVRERFPGNWSKWRAR